MIYLEQFFNLFQVENFKKNRSLKTYFLIWLIKTKAKKIPTYNW